MDETLYQTEVILDQFPQLTENIAADKSPELSISASVALQLNLVETEEKFLSHDDKIYLNIASLNDTSEESIVSFINKIIYISKQKKVSDIHFEGYEDCYRIRIRIDGVLQELLKLPITIANRMSVRLKVMAKLDITERRLPQDGRFRITFDDKSSIDFRVSTCPTIHGEKIVLRLLDPSIILLGTHQLGLNEQQHNLLLKHIRQPQGMIIVTGPTGSGKTVTLYSILQKLNSISANIMSIEDPVEVPIAGINQVQINNKAGINFATILRSVLRQDPDVIMIGEIRDLETAEIAVKAAQTGHLVFTTLHTNSAAESLTRLMNLGLPLYNIATSVSLICAQRLIRKICNYCKARGVKCQHCHQGYSGRTGIFELLPITSKISELILVGENTRVILTQARRENMLTLHEAGIEKVTQNITDSNEIARILTNFQE